MPIQANNLARNNPIPAYKGIVDALYKIKATEGFSALYRGVGLNMVAGAAAHSIFFYIYADGKIRHNYDSSQPYALK